MKTYRSNHIVNQISAWVLIQALIFSPVLPAFAEDRKKGDQTLRVQQPEGQAGLDDLRLRLQGLADAASVAGLEELTASKLIEGWSSFSQSDKRRLRDQLSRLADKTVLARLADYAGKPVNPPATLYQLVSIVLNQPVQSVQQMIEALDVSAYRPPSTTPIGESQSYAWSHAQMRQLLENTVIVVAAGGGGARFKKSLWAELREQLNRLTRLEKPTVMIGPSGTSPIVQTLEEVSELARLVDARGVEVIVVDAPDSAEAVANDIRKNSRFVDSKRVRINVTAQGTFPSFHPQTGKILTSIDPGTNKPVILRNPNGTFGTFQAAYQFAQKRKIQQGKSWLVLYGDDPVLNSGEFIARVLSASADLDVAPVATAKVSRTSPVGGTLVDVVLPSGQVMHLIIEKAEREPDAAKGIAGLPVFNQVEDQAVAASGTDPFGFNTGVLKLSEKAAARAAGLTLPLRHVDRDRDDLLGQQRRNIEMFATHIPTFVGSQPDIRFGVLQVDQLQYGAAKDYQAVVRATRTRDQKSRQRLHVLTQQAGVTVEVEPSVYLDVRPGFRGFTGGGTLKLVGPIGAVFSPQGLTLVPITQTDPDTQQPLFADPDKGKLMLKASPDGRLFVNGNTEIWPSAVTGGLEETTLVTKPARGFATKVARVTDGGLQVAKRQVGRLVGTAELNFASGTVADLQMTAEAQDQDQAATARVLEWTRQGLLKLAAYQDTSVVQRVRDRLESDSLPIQLRANHAMTMDLTDEESALRLDTTIGDELADSRYDEARPVLYAVGLFQEFAQAAGFSAREAAHLTLALYQQMSQDEKEKLLNVLHSPVVDHGNTWAYFFNDASRLPSPEMGDLANVDTLTLEDRMDAEPDADVLGRMQMLRNYRDRWVSWLTGQMLIDLPYDRLSFRRALEKQNIEDRRQATYQVIRDFDRNVEAENARRVSAIVREQWLPEDFPYPVLLAGRESRAFGNQAFLFGNSGYALKTAEVVELTQQLLDAAKGEQFLSGMDAVVKSAPVWAQPELRKSAQRVKDLMAHVGPGTGRIRQQVYGPGKVISLTQFAGAIQQLRENLDIFYTQARQVFRQSQERAVKASREGVGRRPRQQDVAAKFTEAQQSLTSFSSEAGVLAAAINKLEEAILRAESYAAAYSVLMQRPSKSGSEKFKGNELEEKPEQEEALRKLVRLGGQNTYMSPSYDWVAEATDIIEAAPLFIYERTIEVDGKHVTVFEVDQEGLEQTIRQMADYWAQNIEKTMDSEHLALAREMVVYSTPALLDRARVLTEQGLPAEAAHRQAIQEVNSSEREQLLRRVSLTAAWLAREFDRRAEEIERYTEQRWAEQHFIDRLEALRLRAVGAPESGNYPDQCRESISQALASAKDLQAQAERLAPVAMMRRRPLPAFHLLTTEAPGLVEGFIQTVLEEEMALKNVVRSKNLDGEVRRRTQAYAQRIQQLGWQVIQEFGYEPIAEQYQVQGMNREQAIQQVISDHLAIQEEVARFAVLVEAAEADAVAAGGSFQFDPAHPDTDWVENLLKDQGTRAAFEQEAVPKVWERNQLDPDLADRVAQLTKGGTPQPQAVAQAIRESELYRRELESTVRWAARHRVLDQLDRQRPQLQLQDRARRWYRNHSGLSRTTARRETIAANKLQASMGDPRYAYSSGTLLEKKDGSFRPTGGRKRYHLIYAPSRVNLGKGERSSVEVWPQWVGVTDVLAAAHAKRFYELMNFNPQIRHIKEAENLKVSENQWTAMIRAVRNVQAYFVSRLGVGDIEDLAFQFNQRGGLPVAAIKEGESYSAGPTTGYCIPKDLLFKLFVASLQDSRKLTQIGIAKHLQPAVMGMMVHLAASQGEFETAGEWERWAAGELLSPEALQARFSPADATALQKAFAAYVEVTGGAVVYHLTKLSQILQTTGVPSPLLARGQSLHAALWSNWADRRLTLPAEEVNRSVVFSMTRDIPESVAESRRLNPSVAVAQETGIRVHFFGTYKGDEDEAPPPDVRYSWTMRAFMILSGHGKEVALSLDAEGQLLARLSWEGFRPDSTDPEDLKVTRYLAQQFVGRDEFRLPEDGEIVERLKASFPPHTTVGDITMTVVSGVSSEDLLGFSAETASLLGDEATSVQERLQAKGISPEQMRANAQLRRQFPEKWVPLNDLTGAEKALVREAIGGKIHPLVLRLRGPGDDFLRDLQGQDVAVFSVTHPEIMTLDPAHLRDLMLTGRPNSALSALDFVAQGRHRVWFDREIMLWYAAGRGVDSNGDPITDWAQRDGKGRRSVYRAFGWGAQEYRPLLGTNLREEVVRQERRAAALYETLARVADAPDQDLSAAVQSFRTRYKDLLDPAVISTEADLARYYEQQVLLNRRFKARDRVIREALEDIATGLPPEKFGMIHWLSAGGIFLMNGAPREKQEQVLDVIRRAQQRMGGLEENELIGLLIKPQLTAAAIQLTERKGEMFSVKASEEVVQRGVARRKGLALQAAKQAALRAREEGFRSAAQPLQQADHVFSTLSSAREEVRGILSDLQAEGQVNPQAVHRRVGLIMGRTAQVLLRLTQDLITDQEERRDIEQAIRSLTQGRELDFKAWQRFGGTYEDAGILARFFELAGEAGRERVSAAMELLYMTLALDKTADFLVLPAQDVDERLLFRAAAGFFAETMDDHFYEYNPWAFDPKRGSAFGDFYDDLGTVKPEKAEALYEMSWSHHRVLYNYFRYLFLNKTGFRNLPDQERELLLGSAWLGASASEDSTAIVAIGAGAPGRYERLWRVYNQFREMAFVRNDGFAMPVVFENFDPNVQGILDASKRVNHVFLSPIGRTHYSRALMEAGELGENILITRDGVVTTPGGAKGQVLQINDAQFWLTPGRYREALIRFKGMSSEEADQQIAQDADSGRITAKGIRVAARFSRPVIAGSVVMMHHHYLSHALDLAGYPTTDKSPVLFEITYDKALYPQIYNPSSETNVSLPPEVDWLAKDTDEMTEAAAKQSIAEMLRPFAQEHEIIVAKGSAESGARNFQRFDILVNGQVDEQVLKSAVDFVYEVSKGQNVTIQRAIIVTPISWMDPAAVDGFVERQVRDWSVPVNLERHPKSWVYGTLRVINSVGMPADPGQLSDPNLWAASHPISLNSLQVATNVGRQGTLEMLTPEMVRPEFRDTFVRDLEQAGRNGMAAMARYGKRYWDDVYVPAYTAMYGTAPQELDATGVPKWWPRYLMSDFLPEPVWGRNGQEVPGARVVDVIPGDPAAGTQAKFTLQDMQGKIFDGQILWFKFWLLEPNVGIGLWPNYWRREEVRERARAKSENQPVNWSNIGVSDRIVLSNYLAAGEAFLRAKFGDDYFGPGGPHRGGSDPYVPPSPKPAAPAASAAPKANPLQEGLTAVREAGTQQIGPAQASRVLIEGALAAFGPVETLRSQDPESLVERIDQWLADPGRAGQFPQGEGIGVTQQQVGQWLQDTVYRRRVAELTVDRVLSEPLAPSIDVLPEPVSPAAIETMMPNLLTFGVVTGKRALMSHHIYPWAGGVGQAPANVVGVHESWLRSNGTAGRVVIWNAQSGRFLEAAVEQPVSLTHAYVVELPRGAEIRLHAELADRLEGAGIQMINPTNRSYLRADDKRWLAQNLSAGLTETNVQYIGHRSSLRDRLKTVAEASPYGVIIKPVLGTEGEGVEWFASSDDLGQKAHGEVLLKSGRGGGILVSPFRGNVMYQGRPVALRFNVIGGKVTSASAVVGQAGSKIASLGRGGEVIPLEEVLSDLRGPQGQPVVMTQAAWKVLGQRAQDVGRKVDIGAVGLDLVMEFDGNDIRGVVIEANARPGFLIFGEQAEFPEDGPIQSHPVPAADSHFWATLSLPGRSWSPAGESLRRVLVVSSDALETEYLARTIARRHPWVQVDFVSNTSAGSQYLRSVSAGEAPLPDMILTTASADTGNRTDSIELLSVATQMDIPFSSGLPIDEANLSMTMTMMRGMQETFTLSQWQEILADPVRSGFRSALTRFVPIERLNEEINRVRAVVNEAVSRTVQIGDNPAEPLFRPDVQVALSFGPGRVRFFMGHSDLRGLGGQTINAATHYGFWALTQVFDDPQERVVADNIDPEYDAFEFRLSDPDVSAPAGIQSVRPHWLAWAEAHSNVYKWEGLLKAVPALIRTDFMDPQGQRRQELQGKGIRFLLADSNLPSGKGLSSSSALPAVFIRGIQQFLPWQNRLYGKALNDIDYVAYVGGDRAGTADMTAINTGRVGEVSVLGSFPEKLGETVRLPADFRFFVVDSGVKRLDDPSQPPAVKNFAAYIKSMTGMSQALASVWIRHVARTQSPFVLAEPMLMTEPAGHPFGLLRELTGMGVIATPHYSGDVTEAAVEIGQPFVTGLLTEIPNDLTLGQLRERITEPDLRELFDNLFAGFTPLGAHQIPADAPDKEEQLRQMRLNSVIPLRQLTSYGFSEIERGLEYVRAAQRGDSRRLIRLMREAQDGDRAAWTLGENSTLVPTVWGEANPKEAFFRSTPEVDVMADQFQQAMEAQFGENSAAARIMAAGLGGAVAVGVTVEAYEAAKGWFAAYDGGREVIDVIPGGGAAGVSIRTPVTEPAGLEAKPVVETSAVVGLPPVLAAAANRADAAVLPNAADLMIGKASLPSASTTSLSVGVIAGPVADAQGLPTGLAYGAALSRLTTPDGQAVPVVFVVDTADQKGKLMAMGFTEGSVFLVGDEATLTREAAVAAAGQWLTDVLKVGQVEKLGVDRPVTQTIQWILQNLFGIELTGESLSLWESFIDRATLALQA